MPTFKRCKECMSYFMTNEHVVQVVVHVLPDWEDQSTFDSIEVCCRYWLVFDTDILSRQQAGEDILGVTIGIQSGFFHTPIVPQTGPSVNIFLAKRLYIQGVVYTPRNIQRVVYTPFLISGEGVFWGGGGDT